MVRFDKHSFTIEVITGVDPIGSYQALQNDIVRVFGLMTQEIMPEEGLYHLANLLMNMQPPWEQANKMIE